MNFTEKFYKEENLLMKNILVTDEKIMSSDENYNDKETFLSKVLSKEKSMLDTHIVFEYSQITKFIPFEEENGIRIFFKNNDKEEKTYLQFDKAADYQDVLDIIKHKCPRFQLTEEQKGSISAIIRPLLYTVAAAALSCGLLGMAIDLNEKGFVVISGGRRGLKHLFASVADFLGIYGSATVGVLLVTGFIIYTVKVYKKSKTSCIVYKV